MFKWKTGGRQNSNCMRKLIQTALIHPHVAAHSPAHTLTHTHTQLGHAAKHVHSTAQYLARAAPLGCFETPFQCLPLKALKRMHTHAGMRTCMGAHGRVHAGMVGTKEHARTCKQNTSMDGSGAREKYGWCRASAAVMRARGSNSSMRASSWKASGGGLQASGMVPAHVSRMWEPLASTRITIGKREPPAPTRISIGKREPPAPTRISTRKKKAPAFACGRLNLCVCVCVCVCVQARTRAGALADAWPADCTFVRTNNWSVGTRVQAHARLFICEAILMSNMSVCPQGSNFAAHVRRVALPARLKSVAREPVQLHHCSTQRGLWQAMHFLFHRSCAPYYASDGLLIWLYVDASTPKSAGGQCPGRIPYAADGSQVHPSKDRIIQGTQECITDGRQMAKAGGHA